MSQSPQTGQFNSYVEDGLKSIVKYGMLVSIPSNGSIQFLRRSSIILIYLNSLSLNPLKRVNSILTIVNEVV